MSLIPVVMGQDTNLELESYSDPPVREYREKKSQLAARNRIADIRVHLSSFEFKSIIKRFMKLCAAALICRLDLILAID